MSLNITEALNSCLRKKQSVPIPTADYAGRAIFFCRGNYLNGEFSALGTLKPLFFKHIQSIVHPVIFQNNSFNHGPIQTR